MVEHNLNDRIILVFRVPTNGAPMLRKNAVCEVSVVLLFFAVCHPNVLLINLDLGLYNQVRHSLVCSLSVKA